MLVLEFSYNAILCFVACSSCFDEQRYGHLWALIGFNTLWKHAQTNLCSLSTVDHQPCIGGICNQQRSAAYRMCKVGQYVRGDPARTIYLEGRRGFKI
ncbi:uncharacterized protein F4807DRAFT_403674 [Annulohypoxylon truncatum]|uniref:uncharacterized protein n=1 Tax=Annulohypoxylon truncatum TaxID=327061 RepID=UPI002007BE71|nr:uncharacterized protein F4807DRAFT_403674 [Annulohypoxylon truncatum]KAI1214543.1 hypothetical protein F4807DRAFT_403674 [Annulohypoxylon truncatum]